MTSGTRVMYSRAFLRSMRATDSELALLAGTVTEYPYVTSTGKKWLETCRVLWDGEAEPRACRIVNIVPAYKKG